MCGSVTASVRRIGTARNTPSASSTKAYPTGSARPPASPSSAIAADAPITLSAPNHVANSENPATRQPSRRPATR